MISKSNSTNPESFTLIESTSCKRSRNPKEVPDNKLSIMKTSLNDNYPDSEFFRYVSNFCFQL